MTYIYNRRKGIYVNNFITIGMNYNGSTYKCSNYSKTSTKRARLSRIGGRDTRENRQDCDKLTKRAIRSMIMTQSEPSPGYLSQQEQLQGSFYRCFAV